MQNADIQLKNITKTFGPVVANHDVSLDIRRGEIHALLGENGSGKSTLVNMLAGIYKPDRGEIVINGKKTELKSPKDAIGYGIGMVHQHFKLVDVLSAKENIIAGQKGSLFIDQKKLAAQITETSKKYGLAVDPDKKVYNMAVAEKQTVEILKVLYRGADILILDEPTAVLTPQEITKLFEILRNMKKLGCAIIIITHKMNEVLEISDRVTVLRKGEAVATVETAQTDAQRLTEMMVGHEITLEIERADIPEGEKQKLLEVRGLGVKAEGETELEDISFDVYTHEIFGVAGVSGSGQKELCECIAGLRKIKGGEIKLCGESIVGLEPREIIRRGLTMSFVPEDRLGMGLVGALSVVDNVILKNYYLTKGALVDRKKGRLQAEKIVQKYDISTPSVFHQVKKLSGGNIQKVLLGREIDLDPKLLITAYPVRGLDIGASYNIYDILNDEKKSGKGVMFIGEDLDVLIGLCDRIAVLCHGRLMGIVNARTADKLTIGAMMLGQKAGEQA